MNKERGIIKWRPFNSLVEQQQIINNLIQEKTKISKPKLAPEQIEQNENILIEAFYEQIKVKIKYFKDGEIFTIISKILKINYPLKKIYLEKQILLFNQIIKINFLN